MIYSSRAPRKSIASRGPTRLYRYERVGPARAGLSPLILVPSIINRADVLDLRKGQSLARHMAERGLDVFLLDWGEPGPSDAHRGLADYSVDALSWAIGQACEATGAPDAHLLGYCLGGTFSVIAGALGVPGIRSIIALTTPVDLSQPGPLGRLTERGLFDVEKLVEAHPIVPGGLLWTSFQSLDPAGIGLKWKGFFKRATDLAFVRRFLAQERWLASPVDVTGRALREIVVWLYRENRLALGGLELKGRRVDLSQGRVPVLNVMAKRDSIVPAEASRPLAELWGGPVETHEMGGGHIGIAVGSKAAQNLWLAVETWIRGHSRCVREEFCHA